MTFKLISCDGGGVRGLISSTLIRDLNTETGGKLLGQADGFAGTSTGGLISIALGAGVSIDTIVGIYEKPTKIFTPNGWLLAEDGTRTCTDAETNALGSGPGYTECAYTSKGLFDTLNPYLLDKSFNDIRHGKMVAVNTAMLDDPASDPANWRPATFNNRGVDGYGSVSLINACLCTSAAPTYFPPHLVMGYGYFADGGTFANNPVLNGFEIARRAGHVSSLNDIEVISFGTGLSPMAIKPEDVGNPLDWGTSTWMWPDESGGVPATALLNLALDLSASNITTIAQGLLDTAMVRINPLLKHKVPLDGTSAIDMTHMRDAISEAKKMPEWQAAKTMVSNW